ncbi:MAG TPA: SPFH domain-containing protein, partial [Kribbellaceae bacterium]
MAELIIGAIAALIAIIVVFRTVRIVPQARAGNVERLGRYQRTLEPGLNFVVPFVDRVRPLIDLREQVVSFDPQSVITEDNLVVHIDTVLYFQVTQPRAAAYEIVNYIQAIEQLTVTTLRNVIGSLDLEKVLTSREHVNQQLRGVLDEASGKWGIRVNRVELTAIDPPPSVKESMEKQMRADREKRAMILTAEGSREAAIKTAEGQKQSQILMAEGAKQAAILASEGERQA